MQKKRHTVSKGTVYQVKYRLIWCTKYRYAVITTQVKQRLEELLLEKAAMISVQLDTVTIDENTVNVLVTASSTDPPHQVVLQLKGYTSRILREEFPTVKSRLPNLWTRSYYCQSVGEVVPDEVEAFINSQVKRQA